MAPKTNQSIKLKKKGNKDLKQPFFYHFENMKRLKFTELEVSISSIVPICHFPNKIVELHREGTGGTILYQKCPRITEGQIKGSNFGVASGVCALV